jgi:hypothetical protein
MRPAVRSEVKKIVHRMAEILFAAQIAFRSLDRCMPKQELNLLQLATARVAQLRTGSPQVMRRNMLQARSLAADRHHVERLRHEEAARIRSRPKLPHGDVLIANTYLGIGPGCLCGLLNSVQRQSNSDGHVSIS